MRARCETVEAGGYCGVGGEEVPCPGDDQRDFEGLSGLFHEGSGPFQHGEGRMPFIQMTDLRLDAKRTEQSPSADPEYQLLIKT